MAFTILSANICIKYEKMNLKIYLLSVLVAIAEMGLGQVRVHAHNDYEHKQPFWEAFSAGCSSIEADIFLKNGQILVAHNAEDLSHEANLREMYLLPLRQLLTGSIYQLDGKLQVLIDVKSEAYATLDALVELMKEFPDLQNDERLQIVISGNRPKAADYHKYPAYIYFDHQELGITPPNVEKVALVSLNFKKFSTYNGKGRITDADRNSLQKAIDFAHNMGRPIRFWGSPDAPSAWFSFHQLGIDFINTDQPYEACRYLKQLTDRMVVKKTAPTAIKTSFDVTKRIGKSVILMIGDGNGLAQISSGILASDHATNFSKFKYIGLVKTTSADDLVTDSAAGATAIASGKKTKNRYIGANAKGQHLPSILDHLEKNDPQKLQAIVTTDQITGATPAAFYGHVLDRDSADVLSKQLAQSSIDLIASGGGKYFLDHRGKFTLFDELPDVKTEVKLPAAYLPAKGSLPFKNDGRGTFLTQSMEWMFGQFEQKSSSFFMLAENGHIDGAGHENLASNLVEEVLDFDQAIGLAMAFVDAHPETLLVVTADHETGGVSIAHGYDGGIELDFQSNDHTGILVPVFAYGNGAEAFTGFMENTAIFDKLMAFLGIAILEKID